MLDYFLRRNRDFKLVFLGSEEGRRVLAHLYKMCGMDKQIWSPDAHETSKNAGAHRIGQGIQSILSQNEEDVFKTVKGLDGLNRVSDINPYSDPYDNNKKGDK